MTTTRESLDSEWTFALANAAIVGSFVNPSAPFATDCAKDNVLLNNESLMVRSAGLRR